MSAMVQFSIHWRNVFDYTCRQMKFQAERPPLNFQIFQIMLKQLSHQQQDDFFEQDGILFSSAEA